MIDGRNMVNILDVGGTVEYWRTMYSDRPPTMKISLLNLYPQQANSSDFLWLEGDATNMSNVKNGEFDIIFSNSVIEHVGTFGDQKRMADEIIRIGKSYFIQTPNRYFPIEPHFLFPFYNLLPMFIKVVLLTNFSLGYMPKAKNKQEAINIINSVRLLNEKELRILFPNAKLKKERFLGITKSLIVYGENGPRSPNLNNF